MKTLMVASNLGISSREGVSSTLATTLCLILAFLFIIDVCAIDYIHTHASPTKSTKPALVEDDDALATPGLYTAEHLKR